MAKGFFKNRISILIAGLILGVLLYLGPSIILSIAVLLILFSFLAKRPEREKRALTKIIIIALFLRLIFFSVAMYIVYCANLDVSQYPFKIIGHVGQVVRDFDREIKNGVAIARYLRGEFANVPVKSISHHGFGFLHRGAWTQGILNFLFGISPFNLLLFPIIDLWCIIIIYFLAKLLFDERVAAFSSFLYAVMPSTIVISCTNLRFSLSIFSFLLIAFSLLLYTRANNNFKSLLLLAVGIIIFIIFRGKASRPFLMILPFILFIALNVRLRTKFVFLIFIATFFVILLIKGVFIQQKAAGVLVDIIALHTGFSNVATDSAYSNYRIYDDVVYNIDIKKLPTSMLVKMLPRGLLKGIIYFMLAPFPWAVTNTTRLYFYPQAIFWYFIIPFAIWGMLRSLFFKPKEALPIIILCSYFVVLLSLVLGNEGIVARFRELITPFFYIFAGSILCKLFSPIKEGGI